MHLALLIYAYEVMEQVRFIQHKIPPSQKRKFHHISSLNNLSFCLFPFLSSKNLFSRHPTIGINTIIVLCIWLYLFMLMKLWPSFHGVNRLDPHILGTSLLYIHSLHQCSHRHISMLMGLRCDIIHNLFLRRRYLSI